LGSTSKLESKEAVLTGGRMTTDDMVGRIKECIRLRDELVHTIRQLGLTREPRVSSVEGADFADSLADVRRQLEDQKSLYSETQSRIEDLAKRIDESKKQLGRISEVLQAGFTSEDIMFSKGEFNRVLGKMPSRKLEDAQRALRKLMGDQAVLALGNRSKDSTYVLIAAPEEKMPQVLQTMLLYDFLQTEVPRSEEPDLKSAQSNLEARVKELTQELDASREELKGIQKKASETLNVLTDKVQDSLIQLQAVLKMGEGSKASLAFARLAKAPPPKVLTSLTSQGALFESE
jgi:vacuolar-type H+-ATPase subunit I/STV1